MSVLDRHCFLGKTSVLSVQGCIWIEWGEALVDGSTAFFVHLTLPCHMASHGDGAGRFVLRVTYFMLIEARTHVVGEHRHLAGGCNILGLVVFLGGMIPGWDLSWGFGS